MIRPAAPAIHLDTSFLIRAGRPDDAAARDLRSWLQARRLIAISSLAWGEYLCGPVSAAEEAAARLITPHVLPLRLEEAVESARLFNLAGRRRNSFADCVIAATALLAGAELATANPADFQRFEVAGLTLAHAG